MEYFGEVIALGIDAVIVGICFKMYLRTRSAIKLIEDMPDVLDVGPDLKKFVSNQPSKELPYVAVRGSVKAVGSPLHSLGAPDVSAVVQKLTVKEHVVSRGAMGFWADQERTLQETVNTVPFVLAGSRGTKVEVVDALVAEVLDLETVVDHFEPSAPGLIDHLWGFFTGVRQRGLQSTEDVLREGTILTGIGTLTVVPSTESNGDLHLVPPANGAPFFLTAMSLHTLGRHLDRERRMYKWLAVTFGAVGLVLVGAAAHRWWRNQERRAADSASELERRERRRRARSTRDRENVPEALLCVVCKLRERELVLLPCGHVCLCEECGDAVGPRCPVCRANIEKRAAAYVA